MPNSVVIPGGATSATFTIDTSEIYSTEQLKVNASYNGMSQSATLTVDIPRVISVRLNPETVSAGETTTATVTLNGPAPNDVSVLVRLGGYTKFASISTSGLIIPAGQISGQFTVTSNLVPQQVKVSVIAVTAQGATAEISTDLTINLTRRGRTWVLKNVTFNDGGSATGYFTYDAATGTYLDINIATTAATDNKISTPFGIPYSYPNPYAPVFTTSVDTRFSTPTVLVGFDVLLDPAVGYLGLVGQQYGKLGLIFSSPLTNAGGEIPLVLDPSPSSGAYYCTWDVTCTNVPPTNVSQDQYHVPYSNPPAHWYREVISGSVIAQ